MPIKTIVDWIMDTNTCFLLGAGCSKCAGKPLIGELTEKVKESLSKPAKAILRDLCGSYGRPATIEDLINHLLQLHKLLSSRKNQEHETWTPKTIEDEITLIQTAIVKTIGTEWVSNDVHKNFLLRLTDQRDRKTCDIFCLNYDTIIEASLEELKIPYTDGFRGAENAYFDPSLYDFIPINVPYFRLFKLHGSINWIRDNDETVRRRPAAQIADHRRAVVYPAEQKYVQTQYGIYETLLSYFRNRLREDRPNNKLVVIGYSFSDEHINVAIEDSIIANGSNLTVYAFVGPEENIEAQEKRLKEMAERCDDRFNVFVGQHAYISSSIEPDEWEKIKGLDLWKFENLVDLIVGGDQ